MRRAIEIPSALAEALSSARHVVAFTGAGVSAESGIPTFRDALTGLWSRFNPEQLATEEAFARDPALVWGWYEWRRSLVSKAEPNAAHRAIAAMAKRLPRLTVITQNVDDLHERAGSRPIRLHGSLFAPRCFDCGTPGEFVTAREPQTERCEPPRCLACGGRFRPGVVWFGEALPQDALEAAFSAARSCDMLISIGTSSVVYPAADIPQLAARAGAQVVQVNPDRTPLDEAAAFNLRGPAASVLPELVNAAWPETVRA